MGAGFKHGKVSKEGLSLLQTAQHLPGRPMKRHAGADASPVDKRGFAHIWKANHTGSHGTWLQTPLSTLGIHARACLLHHALQLQQQRASALRE